MATYAQQPQVIYVQQAQPTYVVPVQPMYNTRVVVGNYKVRAVTPSTPNRRKAVGGPHSAVGLARRRERARHLHLLFTSHVHAFHCLQSRALWPDLL